MSLVKILCLAFVATVAAATPDDAMVGGCMGCVQSIDIGDSDFRKAMIFALDTINSNTNTMYRYVPEDLFNATYQVVSGFMYRADMKLAQSFCTNNQYTMGSGTDYCPVQPSDKSVTCHVAVWWQSWMKPEYHLTDDSCTEALKKL